MTPLNDIFPYTQDETVDEMPDLDALDNVNLIQKLERAQAESTSAKWQIEYLSSTSEIAYTKSILEEERRLFGQEIERLQLEIDQLRGSESRLLHELATLEDRHEKLESDQKDLRATMDSTFLASWGDGKDIPPFLQTKFPVLYRPIELEEIKKLLRQTISACRTSFLSGNYPDLLEELIRGISLRFSHHSIAEFGRNILLAVDQFRSEDPDCDLIGAVLSEDIGSHALLHRVQLVPDLVDALSQLFPGRDIVPITDVCDQLHVLFPLKTPEAHAMVRLLSAAVS